MPALSLPAVHRVAVLAEFGGPENLKVVTRPIPELTRSDEMLVRVSATSINPIEWKMRQGLGLPKSVWRRLLGQPAVLGLDFSGTVVKAGRDVTEYAAGDEVAGALPLCGADAQYILVRPGDKRTAIACKPANVSHADAALVPFAGLVAYAGLVTHGGLAHPAHSARILIVGASGGVGHLAVQMAKRGLNAEFVVGVCSRKNAGFVEACGADAVLAYDEIPAHSIADHLPNWKGTFDLILDAVGDDAYWFKVAPALLAKGGRFVTAALPQSRPGHAGEDVGPLGALQTVAKLGWRRLTSGYRMIPGLLGGLPSKEGFPVIVGWMREGKVAAKAAATFTLDDIADAHRMSETGRVVGKVSVLL